MLSWCGYILLAFANVMARRLCFWSGNAPEMKRAYSGKLRLWFDLIRDLVATVPLYGEVSPVSQISRAPNGALSFVFVGRESPSVTSLLVGFLVSLDAADGFSSCLRWFRKWREMGFPSAAVWLKSHPRGQIHSRPPADPVCAPLMLQCGIRSSRKSAANLKDHYFDAAMAKKMAAALQANESAGAYNTITESQGLRWLAHSAVAGNKSGLAPRSPVQRKAFAERATAATVRGGPGAVQSRHAAAELHL